ncbi:MAG TPA: hypothetical protein VHC71_09465 [Hyphomicrobium sp.]|jgi:hypothetical protein|nr:hypothetical protein [Hyphomicrobium sp.]
MIKTARLGLLAETLQAEKSFVQRGFTVEHSSESLLVERSGHFRGIWTADKDRYVWTAAGYSQPGFSTASLPEALKYTLTEISKG